MQQKVTAKDAEIQKLTQDLKEKDEQINSLQSMQGDDETEFNQLRENNENFLIKKTQTE